MLSSLCLFTAALTLYRNLALLTSITTKDLRIHTLRITTFFDIGIFAAGIVFALLITCDVVSFSEDDEKILAMTLVSCVIIFSGIISPKLPYNKHTGLRLPWTVQDEDTWNVAHRIIGLISLPIALLYIACSLTVSNFKTVTLCAIAAWIGIPGTISYLF